MKWMILNRRWLGVAAPLTVALALAASPGLAPTQALAAERSVLGVQIQALTEDLARSFGIAPSASGVLVAGVRADSPAAKVGIKTGDVIVEYDGQAVSQPHELSERIAATPVGKTVTVKVLRDGQEMTLSPTTMGMEARPERGERAPGRGRAEEPQTGKFGLALHPLTPEIAQRVGTTEKQGLVVQAVRKGSPADQAGLRRGDVITEVNRRPLANVDELRAALEQSTPDKPAVLLIHRRGGSMYVTVKG
jgi:serine protease Do